MKILHVESDFFHMQAERQKMKLILDSASAGNVQMIVIDSISTASNFIDPVDVEKRRRKHLALRDERAKWRRRY